MSRLWVPEEREGTGEPILDIWEQKTGHLKSLKCNGHSDFRCFSFFRCFERFLGICYQGHICMICCPMGSQPIPEVIWHRGAHFGPLGAENRSFEVSKM